MVSSVACAAFGRKSEVLFLQSFPLDSENMNELRVLDAGQAIACGECNNIHGTVEIQYLGDAWSFVNLQLLMQCTPAGYHSTR